MGTTSKRIRRKSTQTCFDRIKTAFQSSQKNKKGLTCKTIISLVDCFPNFLGCFAQDTLDQSFIRFPVTFLVNVDSFSQKGSHWLAIGLFEKNLEIFDPLGFKMFKWKQIPCELLRFLHRISRKRKVLISKRIQPSHSNNCAFYSLYYVMNRQKYSFRQIQNHFPRRSVNERVLKNYFM